MIIEFQRVRVRPDLRDRYVEKDAEIWTTALALEHGFLGKEVWLAEDGSEVVLVLRWRSVEDWKGVPRARLEDLARRFREEIPDGVWERIECKSYRMTGRVKDGD